MISKFLIVSIIFFSIIACTNNSHKNKRNKVLYSQQTEKNFADLEKERVIERYRRLRRQAMKNGTYVKKRSYHVQKPKKHTQRAQSRKRKPKKKRSYRSVDPVELEKEIEQNLAFHCMKVRKSKHFNNEVECYSYTQNIAHECSNSFNKDDRRLLGCVKRSLKN